MSAFGGKADIVETAQYFLRRQFFQNSSFSLHREQRRHHCADQDHASEYAEYVLDSESGDDPPDEDWAARGAKADMNRTYPNVRL
jgi:hypothetical protein